MINDNELKRMVSIIDKYRNEEYVCGVVDCNLLVLELHEPDKLPRLVGRFKTVRGGIRVARKEFGYSSIYEYVVDNYDRVDVNFERAFDVGVHPDHPDIIIHLGEFIFKVDKDKRFKMVRLSNLDISEYRFFRRV